MCHNRAGRPKALAKRFDFLLDLDKKSSETSSRLATLSRESSESMLSNISFSGKVFVVEISLADIRYRKTSKPMNRCCKNSFNNTVEPREVNYRLSRTPPISNIFSFPLVLV